MTPRKSTHAIVYVKPLVMEFPANWHELSIKNRHEFCKNFAESREQYIYDEYFQLKPGVDAEAFRKTISGES